MYVSISLNKMLPDDWYHWFYNYLLLYLPVFIIFYEPMVQIIPDIRKKCASQSILNELKYSKSDFNIFPYTPVLFTCIFYQ